MIEKAGCLQDCCKNVRNGRYSGHLVSSLAIVDESEYKFWVIDATPDFPTQLELLSPFCLSHDHTDRFYPDGILLTHAHIGHYLGLVYLGREVISANAISVWAMPQMKNFLETNGPWNQLVKLGNIELRELHVFSSLLCLFVSEIRAYFIVCKPPKKLILWYSFSFCLSAFLSLFLSFFLFLSFCLSFCLCHCFVSRIAKFSCHQISK